MALTILRWLAFLSALSLVLVYFRGGSILVRDARRSVDASGGYGYMLFTAVLSAAGAVVLLTQLLVCMGWIPVPDPWGSEWPGAAGALMVTGGIGAAFWVKSRILGRYWSGQVEILLDHRIIESGPYKIVRHPLYALALLIYTGAALAFPVWWVWGACGIMLAGYVGLAEYEDRFLERSLPGYAAYRNRTRYKLIPGLW